MPPHLPAPRKRLHRACTCRGATGRAWAALAAALAATVARGAEPFCDFFSGIGEAAQAQAEHDPESASAAARRAVAAAPLGASAARARAALGLALVAGRRPEDAPHAAEDLAAAIPSSAGAERAALLGARGEALLAAGRPDEAAVAFGDAARAGDLGAARAAAWREPDALLAAGRAADAAARAEALLRSHPDDPAALQGRLTLASARLAAGDARGAAEAWRAVWLDAPERPEAEAAGEALARWRAAGGPAPQPSGEDRLSRAERLLASGRPTEAIAELDRAPDAAAPAAPADRVGALRALALLALARVADAAGLAAQLSSSTRPEVRRAADLVLARAAAREGRTADASRLYERVAAARSPVPGFPEWRSRDLGDEAAFLAAWLHYDAGDFARAVELLERFARTNARSHRADDARWFAAWSLHRLGRDAEATRALERLARGPLQAQARYWQARIAADPASAAALLRQAAQSDPGGWYDVLARARLAALGAPLPPAPRPAPVRPLAELGPDPAADRLRAAAELLALGLRDQALAEVSDLARRGRVRPVAGAAAQLAAFAEDADLPFRMARDHLLATRRAVRWAHPQAYPALLPRARTLGVDPALLLAVMRRESSFRSDARSAAGAEGLLQLVPRTVERLAAVAGVGEDLAGRLGEPEASVTAGAWYLGLLLSRFGDPALAVAAYNAGPRPVAQWAHDRAGMPLDAWVECIPWRETRQYVKIVLAEDAAYRALGGEGRGDLDPDRPVPAPADGVAF